MPVPCQLIGHGQPHRPGTQYCNTLFFMLRNPVLPGCIAGH
jgi:hypothetical protein